MELTQLSPRVLSYTSEKLGTPFSAELLSDRHANDILIFLAASGKSASQPDGYYYACLQWNQHVKCFSKAVAHANAAQAVAQGFADACQMIKWKGLHICVASATPMGMFDAFYGRSAQSPILLPAYHVLQDKQCTLMEYNCQGHADAIRSYIFASDQTGQLEKEYLRIKQSNAQDFSFLRERLYEEYRIQTLAILTKHQVPNYILDAVRNLHPDGAVNI